MKFLTFVVLAVVALSRAEKQEKRGVAAYSGASSEYSAAGPPASLAYAKVQQALAAQQPQYYTQAAAPSAAVAYSQPAPQPQQYQQYQPQPQAVAYAAQPTLTKVAAAAPQQVYRPQFSLAGDVSSFAYSSPVVTYNSLGVLSQVLGKAAPAAVAQKQVQYAAAPAQVAYQQAPVQKVAYAQPAAAAYPVQYTQTATKLALAPQPQQYVAAGPSQQAYATAPQTYTAQTVPQAAYVQAPQYYSAQQPKYATAGVSYAQ